MSLQSATSPYLLQHKDNPVNWYQWGEEAFLAAKLQDKPIFLSIGYSSCYWCHVMAHESFEDPEVAKILNANFVCIKVDREERPDIDSIYMDAVVGLSGHGGWPMSVFVNYNRQPFWGGTYFPKEQFMDILLQISKAWKSNRVQIEKACQEITSSLNNRKLRCTDSEPSLELFGKAKQHFASEFDSNCGGFGKAPKFPPTQQLRFLLRLHRRSGDADALGMVEKTLTSMCFGGICDQIGGGFARYSTDEKWLVPHFEKMLYDNALLTVIYFEAFQITFNTVYAVAAKAILDYILRELAHEHGGFFSAQDAGEVGLEGEYYTWTFDELKQLLNEAEFSLLSQISDVSPGGNFEGRNILALSSLEAWRLSQGDEGQRLFSKLYAKRKERKSPFLDQKILLDWNALTISALVKGGQILGESQYLEKARSGAEFILTKFRDNDLYHSYYEGKLSSVAMLDDYAYFIQALLDLYNTTSDEKWLKHAVMLQDELDSKLWDSSDGGYYSSFASDLIIKKKEWLDGAQPSGNGVAACNLARLARAMPLESAKYREQASKLLQAVSAGLNEYPYAFPTLLRALDLYSGGATNVCEGGECKLQVQFDKDD